MTIPSYTWKKPRGGRRKDPINLVFSNSTLKKILRKFDKSGWHFRDDFLDLVSTQYTPDSPPRNPQDAQRLNGPFWKRYHVRIWNHEKNSFVGSVHYERFTITRGHDPFNFEAGKDKVVENFQGDSWKIQKDKHALGNYNREKYCNGMATEIKEKKS